MDLMTALASIPAIGPELPYIIAAVAACATLAAKLPPPKGNRWYGWLYGTVNFIGINFGHARNATAPAKAPAVDPHAVASPDHSKL